MFGMEITTKIGCRHSCPYCPQRTLLEAYRARSSMYEMPYEVFTTCIDKLPAAWRIHFSGFCEPWLNRDCTRMVRYAHEKGHPVDVFTTLAGMSESDIERLEHVPFGAFWVHLPSRDNQEGFKIDERYLAVLARLQASRIAPYFHTRSSDVHPAIRMSDGATVHHEGLNVRGGNVDLGGKGPPPRRRGVIECTRSLRQNVLLPNGEVVLCCMDYGLKHVLGNLFTDSFESLYAGPEFSRVSAGLADERQDILCRSCDVFACSANARATLRARCLPALRKVPGFAVAKSLVRKLLSRQPR